MHHPSTMPSQTSNEQINIALGGSEFKVIYNPNISPELKAAIKKNVHPSLESTGGSSNQYEPSEIAELVNGNSKVADTLSEADFAVVDVLNSHYDYIEF